MFHSFRQRSMQLEHLDMGDYTQEEYEGCIIELQRVNRWLGDARALRNSLLKDIEDSHLSSFSILDVGAGSGELLQVIAEWANSSNRKTQLTGLELNARSAEAIAEKSMRFPLISSLRGDALKLPFADNRFDYAICSLFTHHFADDDVVKILRELNRVARRGIYVIDLHRHPVAYLFFTTVGRLFLHNRLIREDGALSIRRSFRPEELASLARHAELDDFEVQRHFPYRLVLKAKKHFKASVSQMRTGETAESKTRVA